MVKEKRKVTLLVDDAVPVRTKAAKKMPLDGQVCTEFLPNFFFVPSELLPSGPRSLPGS